MTWTLEIIFFTQVFFFFFYFHHSLFKEKHKGSSWRAATYWTIGVSTLYSTTP